MRFIIAILTLCTICTHQVFASNHSKTNTALKNQPITVRLSYEPIKLPDNLPTMGVLGTHALINFTRHWYGGAALYGAVNGQAGGYLAMSLDGGFQHPLYKKLWIDIGASLGAGGGRIQQVGGGLYIQPRAGLSYHFKYFNLGANYNYINFINGSIKSQQWGVTLSVPTTFSYANATWIEKTIHAAYNIALARNYMALIGSAYFPSSSNRTTDGQSYSNDMELMGIEAGHYFNPHWFIFGQGQGAFHGHKNGFAIFQFGAGAQWHLNSNSNGKLSLITKLGIGSSGGGGIDTGGGLIIQPTAGLEYRLNQNLALEANGGYLTAPSGHFNNVTGALLLKYYFNKANLAHSAPPTDNTLTYQGWRIRLLNQTYFRPRNDLGGTNRTMQLIGLNIDHWLNRYFYATGQSSYAYSGQSSGGYFTGMLGIGSQLPISRYVSLFIEALAGAAGGGGLDVAGGAVYEPIGGINIQCSPSWNIQLSAGQIMAFSGKLHSTTLNAGIGYSFATLE